MSPFRILAVVLVAAVCAACGSKSDSGDSEPSSPPPSSSTGTSAPRPSTSAAVTPTPVPSSPAVSEPSATASATTAQALLPGHSVKQLDDNVIANRESYGKGWPWKTSDVVMECSDAVGGGAILNAADGENYLLTGTITRPGFVKGNAGTELWNGSDGDAYALWLDAGAKLCPDAS